jgi:hypothetical protein
MADAGSALLGSSFLLVLFLLVPRLLGVRDRAGRLVGGAIAAAASVVIVSIALSLVHGLTRGWMLAGQAFLALAAAGLWSRAGRPRLVEGRPPGLAACRRAAVRHPLLTTVVAAAVGALGLQAVIAVAVAPNNWDSMTYHLSRVAYWLQNDSALHYEAATIRQLASAPNGELLQAWTVLMSGTDRLANLVQWGALCGLGVSLYATARSLGHPPDRAAFAGALFVVLPQPIMQATSTQNDLIVSFFVSATALFAVRGLRGGKTGELVLCGASLGLAIGAKGTALLALLPLGLIVLAGAWELRPPPRLLLRFAATVAAGIAALGAFNYVLNLDTYGDPIGDIAGQVERKTRLLDNAARIAWSFADAPGHPLPWVTLGLERPVTALVGDLGDPSFGGSVLDARVSEDLSSYGLFGLFVMAPWLVWILVRRESPVTERAFAAASLAYVVLFALLNEQNPWVGRVLMPAVVLGAPALAGLLRRPLLAGAAVATALVTLPPALLVNDRKPILVPRGTPSIFERDRLGQQTLPRPEMLPVIRRLNELAGPNGSIGLVRGEDVWDYPFFGPKLARRVVPLERSQVTFAAARDEGLVGVVVADVEERPPRALQLAPRYWFIPRRALLGRGSAALLPREARDPRRP